MNLKESFRYQNWLESMMRKAEESLMLSSHSLIITKKHMLSQYDPEVENRIENVEEEPFYSNDSVISFMQWLILERHKLTKAINEAKSSLDFDIDATLEANKFRRSVINSIDYMLKYFKSKKKTEEGKAYKFNNEGNQMPYYYDIEVEIKEAFDREVSRFKMKSLSEESDVQSSKIDSAMINTEVNYTPTFDVNDTFEDVMEEFERRLN